MIRLLMSKTNGLQVTIPLEKVTVLSSSAAVAKDTKKKGGKVVPTKKESKETAVP
jgi:hypothetical protein